MTCRELAEFLSAWLNGELSKAEAAEFERHLSVCPACIKYVDSYKKTIALGRDAFRGEETVKSVPESLVQAILSAKKRAERD